MNKYYQALDNLCNGNIAEQENARQVLLQLIYKMEKIGLELNNAHFMDNDCKLKELEMIERIFRE